MALLSHVMGLNLAYALVSYRHPLLPIGVYRYARIWVGERAASYAVGSVLGSLAALVCRADSYPPRGQRRLPDSAFLFL